MELASREGVSQRKTAVRDRILSSAYELFSEQGLAATGVDAIVAHAGVAKASLYKHFPSKNDLIAAFLALREERWTQQWLKVEVLGRAEDPRKRLLIIFDVFNEWFHEPDLEGCSFINTLLETQRGEPINLAAAKYLENIRSFVLQLASDAELSEIEEFAFVWHTLMKGSIVTALEGHLDAAKVARRAAEIILKSWPSRG